MERIPILFDTDPGSDIDDVLALAYLLKQPRCDLLGITTVTGDVGKRAAIVEIVCNAFGRKNIPIHAGTSQTLAHGPGQPNVPHYDAVASLPHRKFYKPDAAVDFLRQTIRKHPHEITLLSVGPFTNVGLLFALDPEIPSLLKGFVSMAGSFFREDKREWNCICDPAATLAAVKRGGQQTMIGLDVTTHCVMPAAEVRERFAKAPLDVLLKMAETFFQNSNAIMFHDPLAAVTLFEPSICQFATGEVTIDPNGATLFKEEATGRHRVGRTVDSQAFFARYFDIVKP